ncbi:MAG: ABC-F family ATP-binding cassette domain-containing protein [Sedimentibacter sp.]
MITVSNLSLQFGGSKLFNDVNLKFVPGNCYGVIGANGAGKSTFLKILSGEIDYTSGEISIPNNVRMSVLKQDHFMYDEFSVMETVMMGNTRLYEIMKEKEALYAKEDFTDEDGVKASVLEGEFSEMNGWDAETEIAQILQGLGVGSDLHYRFMSELNGGDKVKVMLAQALFGRPGIILLDEPTNNLDIECINWLEDFLLDFEGLVIVVSHDRHFLNTVCTHIVDIDFKKIRMYVGNYDFWYESSQLMQQLMKDQNRKREDKIKDLQGFIQRFSANKSKSKQATSRRKLLDKLEMEDMPTSSRRYPFVKFNPDREVGNEILTVEGLSKKIDGKDILKDISFRVNRDDKIAFVGENELAQTTLFKILTEELEPDSGTIKWGQTITKSYFPKDNTEFFENTNLHLVDWMRQYSEDQSESFLRGFLGRMLFSGDDALKYANVLSGGERVRCMLSRMMLSGSNVLILDQPTNHLDLESITALNNGLMDYKEIALFSSHDHQFIQTVANRVIELNEDGMVDMAMTFDEYLERKENKQKVT